MTNNENNKPNYSDATYNHDYYANQAIHNQQSNVSTSSLL